MSHLISVQLDVLGGLLAELRALGAELGGEQQLTAASGQALARSLAGPVGEEAALAGAEWAGALGALAASFRRARPAPSDGGDVRTVPALRDVPRGLAAGVLVLALGVGAWTGYVANLGGQIRHTEVRSGATAADATVIEPRPQRPPPPGGD